MTSATEKLRRLLDERGVEWAEYGDGYTLLRHGGREYTVQPNICNRLIVTNLTPEQAIAATLGAGTCTADETETWECVCDQIGRYGKRVTVHVMECSECGHTYEHVNGDYEFCPHCGRRVVEVDA